MSTVVQQQQQQQHHEQRWYGVPGASAGHFESAMAELLPELVALQPDLLLQLVTMVNPLELAAKGVPVYCATQQPGEFVITFPQVLCRYLASA
jgi:[histone H3]-trimethyl-L-lysine4 demethylase